MKVVVGLPEATQPEATQLALVHFSDLTLKCRVAGFRLFHICVFQST